MDGKGAPAAPDLQHVGVGGDVGAVDDFVQLAHLRGVQVNLRLGGGRARDGMQCPSGVAAGVVMYTDTRAALHGREVALTELKM